MASQLVAKLMDTDGVNRPHMLWKAPDGAACGAVPVEIRSCERKRCKKGLQRTSKSIQIPTAWHLLTVLHSLVTLIH